MASLDGALARWSRQAARIALGAAAVSSGLVAAASPAAANGRFPASNQILFSAADPDLVVLRTTFGILVSRDQGATYSWLCEDALGLATISEDPAFAVTAGDALVAGLPSDLEVSADLGCDWTNAGGFPGGGSAVDLAVRPDAPHAVVALRAVYGSDAGADGGAGFSTQVYESTDDGSTWSKLGSPLDPSLVPTTIEVAATDPHRLYVSATRAATEAGAAPAALLLVSVDDGATWTERLLPPLDAAAESAVFIGAVDPSDANVVYLRSAQSQASASIHGSRLFVTTDAGATFRVPLALAGQMLGFAVSSDGSRVYAGGPGDGLLVAARSSLGEVNPFQKVSTIHVQCLAAHGADLWACSDEVSGFVAGVSTSEGACFTPRLHLLEVDTPIACEADATAAVCNGLPFQRLCETFGNCPDPDAGTSGSPDAGRAAVCSPPPGDGGTGADAGETSDAAIVAEGGADASPSGSELSEPPGATASSGCGAGPGPAGAKLAAVAACVAWILVARRRAASRRA